MRTGVYCIRNIINGKVYVGSASVCLKKRWCDHRKYLRKGNHYNSHLQSSWNKYSEKSFKFVILLHCFPDDCINVEQCFIDLLKSSNHKYGYNISPTAGSRRGVKLSEEALSNLRDVMKVVTSDPEYRRKMSETITAVLSDPEVRARISKGVRHRLATDPTVIEKIRASSTGRKHSEVTKAKISISGSTPEAKRKKSLANLGKPRSEEVRERMSKGRVRYCAENKSKVSICIKKGWLTRKANKAAAMERYLNGPPA